MRLLALDLGTKTGFATNDPKDGGCYSGAKDFKPTRGESYGVRFLAFRSWLDDLLQIHSPGLVVYEQAHHRGGPATDLLVGMAAILKMVCAEQKIEIAPVHSMTLKKHATGSGKAKKPEMIEAAKKRWPNQKIKTDDEADALLALAWGIEKFG